MDVDNYGHVNNVEYLSYFDTAVNGWYIDNGLLDMEGSKEVFLVVETSCSYFAEIKFPDVVFVGIRVEKIGNSSVCFEIALFRNDGNRPCALGKYVHVLVDRQTRKPTPLSPHYLKLFGDAQNPLD